MEKKGVTRNTILIWQMLNHNPTTDLYFNNQFICNYELQKGLRQGASSSPVIYNLFPDE